jgi:hypothetical protein
MIGVDTVESNEYTRTEYLQARSYLHSGIVFSTVVENTL